jgi:phosphoribosylaminoimidazole-succinocarboxamide synthase
MSEEFVNSVSERYIELFENITGDLFKKSDTAQINERIEASVTGFLKEKV